MLLLSLSPGHRPACMAGALGSLQCLLLAEPHGSPVGSVSAPSFVAQWGLPEAAHLLMGSRDYEIFEPCVQHALPIVEHSVEDPQCFPHPMKE